MSDYIKTIIATFITVFIISGCDRKSMFSYTSEKLQFSTTLSMKEIIGNESQERMGLIISPENLSMLKKIAERERAPLYVVGDVTGDRRFVFESASSGKKPIDLSLDDMFGSSPKTVMADKKLDRRYAPVDYRPEHLQQYLEQEQRKAS